MREKRINASVVRVKGSLPPQDDQPQIGQLVQNQEFEEQIIPLKMTLGDVLERLKDACIQSAKEGCSLQMTVPQRPTEEVMKLGPVVQFPLGDVISWDEKKKQALVYFDPIEALMAIKSLERYLGVLAGLKVVR